jgi:hypothetical protein
VGIPGLCLAHFLSMERRVHRSPAVLDWDVSRAVNGCARYLSLSRIDGLFIE